MLNTSSKIARFLCSAALVGAVGVAVAGPAQAASQARSPQAGDATQGQYVHLQGKLTAVADDHVKVTTGGTVVTVLLTDDAYWIGHLKVGAQADVTATLADGVYTAKVIVTW
ncbi:hypothetical protein C9F11_01280 [Streptomyces sp. YIM 121038]|uniref:hypothetical protein n=1 Tax=Streptomyces sp. YIM 121038 TaxID=2136401 RepID=UPI0011102509|nr:hypothetical protein [Streptomyces sp. YIM 121038]QCX73959.1 hypothetical protein C9F11_01280 [Streptomyces sp. YIM 121038]